jgi:hypothetical protein
METHGTGLLPTLVVSLVFAFIRARGELMAFEPLARPSG